MKKILTRSALMLSMSLLTFCASPEDTEVRDTVSELENLEVKLDNVYKTSSTPIQGQYIVVLNDGVLPNPKDLSFTNKGSQKQAYFQQIDAAKASMVATAKGPEPFAFDVKKIKSVYTFALDGFVANLTDDEVEMLRKDPRVKSIDQDRLVTLKKPRGGGGGGSATQQIPYGITRVGGAGDGTGKTAWVLDTGIDLDHEDLNVDVARSVSFTGDNNPNDVDGHGTHVAGTIAAIDNNIGVVGVAAGASVVACKVLGDDGTGAFSWTVQALDYVRAVGSNGDVANMSLGPQSRFIDSATDNATAALGASGIKVAIAAGNSYDDCSFYSPARTNQANVFTISGIGEGDVVYWFSNYGSPVDYAAPGVNVLSTTPGNTYASFSGTSMASPHAAGVLLLGSYTTDGVRLGGYFQVRGNYILLNNYSATDDFNRSVYREDPDGVDDPIIVRN